MVSEIFFAQETHMCISSFNTAFIAQRSSDALLCCEKVNKVGMWSTLINDVPGRTPDTLRPWKDEDFSFVGTENLQLWTGAVLVAGLQAQHPVVW